LIIIIITKRAAESKHFDGCGDPVYAESVRGFLKIIIIISGIAFASTLIVSTAKAPKLLPASCCWRQIVKGAIIIAAVAIDIRKYLNKR
jgi:ABC-type glucose/galactose transport system permease subunit